MQEVDFAKKYVFYLTFNEFHTGCQEMPTTELQSQFLMSKIILTFRIFFVSVILVLKENGFFKTLCFVKFGACESQ